MNYTERLRIARWIATNKPALYREALAGKNSGKTRGMAGMGLTQAEQMAAEDAFVMAGPANVTPEAVASNVGLFDKLWASAQKVMADLPGMAANAAKITQAQNIAKLNVQRAAQGLPMIADSGVPVTVGIDAATKQLLIYAGLGVVGLVLVLRVMKK